jgi:hypothetical protein
MREDADINKSLQKHENTPVKFDQRSKGQILGAEVDVIPIEAKTIENLAKRMCYKQNEKVLMIMRYIQAKDFHEKKRARQIF